MFKQLEQILGLSSTPRDNRQALLRSDGNPQSYNLSFLEPGLNVTEIDKTLGQYFTPLTSHVESEGGVSLRVRELYVGALDRFLSRFPEELYFVMRINYNVEIKSIN